MAALLEAGAVLMPKHLTEHARLLTASTACAVYKYLPDIDIFRCVRA